MEAADKKNADDGMEAFRTFTASAAGELTLSLEEGKDLDRAIEWMQNLLNKWSQWPRDSFAKKQWESEIQLRMQLTALKKRRNSRDE